MKTWNNPSVEELEVKMTAWWDITDDSEAPDWNGVPNEITGEPVEDGKGPQS